MQLLIPNDSSLPESKQIKMHTF
ncbi:hypothetical protein EC958_4741 [Escherichia coli O25b:H4-ST131]|uniref:Uncharacterized protein n=1 Tax=Escherichia coli O25b:H4-ST131 TaxID=941322 RepID=A0AA36L3G4_ECOLX|nr:hypothetical protein EC958_4741 [Escherichia coli O25b:H4-ST131]